MAGTRYSYNVDLDNLNSSHSLAVLSVPPGSCVLDLGAADGSVARALKERGCEVWGIEQDERAAEAALQVCDRVVVADLETTEAWQALGGETFDVILALDVLEHLRDPAPVLRRAASHLKPMGIVVVSVPNVTHGALRLSLLQGRFDYTDLGLLDRTHLRFFDRRGAERLIAEAGLVVSEHLRVSRGLEDTEIPVNKDGVPAELLESIARDPDATTYQFVFVVRRADGPPALLPGAMLSERLLAENEGIRARFTEVEKYARDLEADRATAPTREALQLEGDELREELDRRTKEAHQMRLDVRHSKADVVVKEAFIAELRHELQSMNTLAAERDQRAAERDQRAAERNQLVAERDQLVAERDQLVAHKEHLEGALRDLRIYANSAGFRLVERVIVRLRRVPFVFRPARAMVRKMAGWHDLPS